MYQYISKKTTASAKSVSSHKGKNTAFNRRIISNSPSRQYGRQAFGVIQRARDTTAMSLMADNQYSGGSARPPYEDIPMINSYCAGSARRCEKYYDTDVLEAVEEILSKNNWREQISSFEEDIYRQIIRGDWAGFLCLFLKHHGFRTYGAFPSHTYHRPASAEAAKTYDENDKQGMSKIEEMYAGSSSIRSCRKYKTGEEIKRYLRHCAAALAINYGIEKEIQCYYDDNIVYVAANHDNDTRKLSPINGKRVSECEAVLQYSYKEMIKNMTVDDNSDIWGKFRVMLCRVILSTRESSPLLRRLGHALLCPDSLKNATFQVISDNYGADGLHAERKILYHLREIKRGHNIFMDSLMLGGIRRPCFICSALCFADMLQIHPGPVWVSNAAAVPRDAREMFLILHAVKNNAISTFISCSEGHLTMDNDSDSEEG